MYLDWSYSEGEVGYEVGVLPGEGVSREHLKWAESCIVLTQDLPKDIKIVNVCLLGLFK